VSDNSLSGGPKPLWFYLRVACFLDIHQFVAEHNLFLVQSDEHDFHGVMPVNSLGKFLVNNLKNTKATFLEFPFNFVFVHDVYGFYKFIKKVLGIGDNKSILQIPMAPTASHSLARIIAAALSRSFDNLAGRHVGAKTFC
jgi:hypothetical protein